MLSVKQGGIKHHFLSLSYDSTSDWTPVSLVIGERSNYYANIQSFIESVQVLTYLLQLFTGLF